MAGEALEGFRVTDSVYKMMLGSGEPLPILREVYAITQLGRDPLDSVDNLFKKGKRFNFDR